MPLWFRTHHGDHKHFAFQINEDGTISPEKHEDFVWALGESKHDIWKSNFANHIGWHKSHKDLEDEKERIKQLV